MEATDIGGTLASFMDITGTDDATALQMLEATGWQLEAAVQLFFGGGHEGGPSNERGPHPALVTSALGGDADPPATDMEATQAAGLLAEAAGQKGAADDEYVRPPLPVKREALYDDLSLYRAQQMAQAPQHTRIDTMRNFREEAAERARRQQRDGPAEETEGPPKDKLAALFRPPFEIMFQGTFEQAKAEGTRQGKWLLVNVQSHQEFASHAMNRDTWSHEAVKETIGSYFVFWQIYEDTEEGRKVCTYYRLQQMPVTLVLDPQTGQRMRAWDGLLNPGRLLEDVLPFMDRGPLERRGPVPPQKRARDLEVPAPMVAGSSGVDEEEEEEEELRRALAASLEPPSTNAGATGVTAKEAAKLHGQAEEAALGRDGEAGQPEISPLPEEPADGPGTCRIAFRLPTGGRTQRRFLTSDPVKYLRSFCCQQVPEAAGGRLFKLGHAIPGAAPLNLDSEATILELGLANSMLAMSWL